MRRGRRAAQIRRYVYCDVVRSQDVQRYLDPAGVQMYIINQAKVVFLNQRPQSKPTKARARTSLHSAPCFTPWAGSSLPAAAGSEQSEPVPAAR